MLKIFGVGRADHPMADPRAARRILDELPAQDHKAVEELAHWHESVAAAEGFKLQERLQLLALVDDATQPRLRKLTREYFSPRPRTRFQEAQLWGCIHDYWRNAGLAFAHCIGRALKGGDGGNASVPALVLRALRSLGQQVKWQHLRYGPVDTAVWGVLNRVYAFAEVRAIPEAKAEFLKVAMFSAASPGSLLPLEMELAERLIGELAPRFALASAPAPELPYWTDLSQAMAPLRAARPPLPGAGLRCFGQGGALAALETMAASVQRGGGDEVAATLDVMRHLAVCWASEPPARKHPRHSVKTRLSVAHGFEGVLGALGGGDSLDFGKNAPESWIVENVSAGGFGALVPQMKTDWLRVGTLLALQPDGGDNWVVGRVRRVTRVSQQEARVGIQTLSKAPAVSSFDLRGVGPQSGILLDEGAEPAIALPAGVYTRGLNLEAERGGRQRVYMPQGIAERGEDYEIVRFREMIRES
jgi:hypothetical protein